ncbi:MAG: efflux RND transporter periplasmic adaptor subunit [Desulfobacteraceae bacterium]|jgi:membrane fusion protein (multidrug efflux system)
MENGKKKRSVLSTHIAVFGVLALLVTVTACGKGDPKATAGHGPGPGGPVEVSVVTIQPEQVSIETELSGRVSAFLVAEVRPQVGGIIQKVQFTEGSEVKQGEILYRIDPALFKAAYDSACAALARAEANVPPAKTKAARYKDLVKVKAISQQEEDEAHSAFKKAEADVLAAKADLQKARINLEYTAIKAPISGRIGKSSVTTGALVTGFQATSLATIQKLDPVYVDVTQSSSELLRLRKNLEQGLLSKNAGGAAKVRLLLEDGSEYAKAGTLKFSDVTVDPGTGSVILRSVFENPKQTLLPGMFVRTMVEEGQNDKAILVPQQCVARTAKGEAMAMAVGASDKVEPRMLVLDRAMGNRWIVASGLNTGDRIIAEGLQKVKPGDHVKTVPFGEPVKTPEPGGPASAEPMKKEGPSPAEK